MKILILNWRDLRNPNSGGAEVLTQEMAKRWVAWKHDVFFFSELFAGAKEKEVIDGIEFHRAGSADIRSWRLPVHLAAWQWYQKNRRNYRFDVVLDEIHGLPFFTPFYVREKKVALLCEVAKNIWDRNFSFPINFLGKTLEKNYFRFYRQIPFLTISESTKKDIVTAGIAADAVTVLPMGLNLPQKLPAVSKETKPTLIFVGRLSRAKGVADALTVYFLLKKDFPALQLWIVGRKNAYYQELKKLTGGDRGIRFFGFVPEAEKFLLMAKAHVLLNPSIREGWGLTVPEAGAVGTPTVAYRVPGLQDIIKNNQNGLLTAAITPQSMAVAVGTLLKNKPLYRQLQAGIAKTAAGYNWDRTAKIALKILRS